MPSMALCILGMSVMCFFLYREDGGSLDLHVKGPSWLLHPGVLNELEGFFPGWV